jgi:hypothetical protein
MILDRDSHWVVNFPRYGDEISMTSRTLHLSASPAGVAHGRIGNDFDPVPPTRVGLGMPARIGRRETQRATTKHKATKR